MSGMGAVGWRLYSPSTSGGKLYDIMVVGTYVIGRMQYKVEQHHSANNAKAWAVEQTEAKERKGYQLTVQPRQSEQPAEHWEDWVKSWAGFRGASSTLDANFRILFK